MRAVGFLARPRVAIGLWALSVTLVVATVFLGTAIHHKSAGGALGISSLVADAVLLVVGTVVAARRPRNIIGWLLLGGGLFLSFSAFGGEYSLLDYRYHHGSLAARSGIAAHGPGLVARHPLRRRRRDAVPRWPAARAGVEVGDASDARPRRLVVRGRVRRRPLGRRPLGRRPPCSARAPLGCLAQIDNPTGQYAWWGAIQAAFFFSVVLAWIVWIVQAIPHYRRSTGEARVQQK